MENGIGGETWLVRLTAALRCLQQQPGTPFLDVEWLLLRCEDSAQYQGHWREASLRQLVKDVQEFDAQFPGLLPRDVLEGVEAHSGSRVEG